MVLEKRICLNSINTIVNIFNCNTNLDHMEELIRESIRQKKFKEVKNTVHSYLIILSRPEQCF